MRIGINASFLSKPMTGIGQVTREFLKHLVHHPEFEQHEWFLYTDGELSPHEKASIPEARWEWRPVTTWWKRADVPHQYLIESQALPCVVDGDRVDVFLSLYQSATILPTSIRHIMLVHDMIPKLFPEYLHKLTNRLHYRSILKGIHHATHILTPSTTTKEDITKLLGIDAVRITALPLGVDRRFFERLDAAALQENLKRYQLIPGYLYHGGGLEIRKNTETVLRAYADLVKEGMDGLPPLVISGKVHAENNPLATPVKKLIQELGIADKVKLLGLVPEQDLPALYQGASLFLFPSRYEGFGLPVLEAYAAGTPVITTQAGSLKELAGGKTALVIENLDESQGALKELIRQGLADQELRAVLRERGQKRAAEYSWEHFTEKVFKALLQ